MHHFARPLLSLSLIAGAGFAACDDDAAGGVDSRIDTQADTVADTSADSDGAIGGGDTDSVAEDVAPDDTKLEVDTDAETGTVTPRIVFPELGRPTDLTPDGAIALFQKIETPDNEFWFFDTSSESATLKGASGDFERPVLALSSGGERVAAFHGDPIQAAYWSADGWHDLGALNARGCDLSVGSAWDISADGHSIVGLAWNACDTEAFLWSDAAGPGAYLRLEVLGSNNRASKIADDGSLIGGWASGPHADRSPAVWTPDGKGTLLDPAAEVIGEVLAVNADGTRVAGMWNGGPFTWTAADGVVEMGLAPGALPGDMHFPNAIAADGRLIFGGAGDAWMGTIRAFVWDAAHGMRSLEEVARAAGVELPSDYSLGNVFAASSDGTVLLGSAFEVSKTAPFPIEHGFVMTLPLEAYGL